MKRFGWIALVLAGALLLAGAALTENETADRGYETKGKEDKSMDEKSYQKATFAGGCFWCMEPPFDNLDGVISTTSGYAGGTEENPTYEEVSSGRTGHAEVVQVLYDQEKVSYEKLLDVFWKNIDPTQKNGQFVDIGNHYRSAIFYHDEKQRELAEKSKKELEASGLFENPLVTRIEPAGPFYPAETYHQEYYRKNPERYKLYRYGSGRDKFLDETWDRE